MGSAAFLAPDIVTVPLSGVPPLIESLSKRLLPAFFLPFVGRQRRDRQCVNFISDKRAEALVHELVPRDGTLSFEFCSDDKRLEMCIVVTQDLNDGVFETAFDQLCDMGWVHVWLYALKLGGAQCNRIRRNCPTQIADLCIIARHFNSNIL